MPSIASRTIPVSNAVDPQHAPATTPAFAAPPVPPPSAMAYSRGAIPLEFSNQSTLALLQPDSPFFQRSNIEVTTAVRNLSLTALTKRNTKNNIGAPS